jgi:hypothetical protein
MEVGIFHGLTSMRARVAVRRRGEAETLDRHICPGEFCLRR